MLPNGEIEYQGRSDFQLKINGVRIEPGEIEARAAEYPGVKKCVVVATNNPSGRYLVGYYTTKPQSVVDEVDLIQFLEKRLIRCMVPARMVHIESIPVNVNGKVDWRALPEVTHTATEVKQEGFLSTLQSIWASVLNLPVSSIGPRSNFFR